MQQQPSQPPPPASIPLNAITTQQIQKYLEENKNLIMAILEYQRLGKFQECAQYQAVLQKNLMYLAAVADAQSPTPQIQNPSQVMQTPPNLIPQASNFMQQPPQQAGGRGGQKLPFELSYNQDQQQQLLHFQRQQQFQAQMGLRFGGQSGMLGMESALAGNHGGRQGGSEMGYGGDSRGMFFDNGSF